MEKSPENVLFVPYVKSTSDGCVLAGTLILMILLGLAGYEYIRSKQMLSL